MNEKSSRYALLDELRGLDLISMMLYHGMWDLLYLFGVRANWYTGLPGQLWQQCICWIFILLSGFCLPFGHHSFRRGAVVFGAGALVTAVTLLFLPEDVVWFGVLTLLGSAMLLTALLKKPLRNVPPAAGLAVSFVLFVLTYHTAAGYWGIGNARLVLPAGLFRNYLTAYFGFYPVGFYSHRLFPAAAVAVFVLVRFLSAPSGGAEADGAAASVGLRTAGLDGAAIAAVVSAPPAGALWRVEPCVRAAGKMSQP